MTSIAELKQRGNQQNQQVANKPKTIFDFLTGDPKIEKAIGAVATQYLTPDRFLRLAVNAVKKTPLLMQCDPQTVLGSFMTSAALGLEPNTILQQAFLIPYKKRKKEGNQWVDTYECQFQIGARGFVTLAHRSPHIHSIYSEAIHERDMFEHMLGSESFLKYKKTLKDRGDLVGSFCFTKLESGIELATVLPLEEIEKIRSKSETYNALVRNVQGAQTAKDRENAEKKLAETPWVMWADDMAAKSATKKHAKQLPLSPGDAMAAAVALDADGDSVIDMASMANPETVRTVMRDGVDALDPAEQSGYGFPALSDEPSETLQTMGARAATAEAVEVNTHADNSQPAASQAAEMEARRGTGQPASDFDKLKHRLSSLSDVDMLDAEASLIGDMIEEIPQQDELRAIYKARREELINGATGQPAQQPPAGRQRRQMNLE